MRLARDRIMKDKIFYFRNSPGGMEEMLRKEKRKKRDGRQRNFTVYSNTFKNV